MITKMQYHNSLSKAQNLIIQSFVSFAIIRSFVSWSYHSITSSLIMIITIMMDYRWCSIHLIDSSMHLYKSKIIMRVSILENKMLLERGTVSCSNVAGIVRFAVTFISCWIQEWKHDHDDEIIIHIFPPHDDHHDHDEWFLMMITWWWWSIST